MGEFLCRAATIANAALNCRKQRLQSFQKIRSGCDQSGIGLELYARQTAVIKCRIGDGVAITRSDVESLT